MDIPSTPPNGYGSKDKIGKPNEKHDQPQKSPFFDFYNFEDKQKNKVS